MTDTKGRLAGRTAIVTGASRGIGKSIAEVFAAEGAAVAVAARTVAQWDERLPGTIHETVDAIEAGGGRAVAIQADLSDLDDVERLHAEAREALGPIDLLVNNAALTLPGRPPADQTAPRSAGSGETAAAGGKASTTGGKAAAADAVEGSRPKKPWPQFVDFPLKGFRRHFDVGLFASFRLMQLVLPDMLAAGRGGIVNISSIAGFMPGEGPYPPPRGPSPFAYGGNKAALHHLTQSVAAEVQHDGVAVNVLSPSEPVITPGNLIAAAGETDWADPDEFAEATLRVAIADPAAWSGKLLWSEDVLHPEAEPRGWIR